MRTDYTRQTRWGHEPDEVDADLVGPGSVYVRQVTWAPCTECDLQVHIAVRHLLAAGIVCPECGSRLVAPMGGDAAVAAAEVARQEERFQQQLEREEDPCSD
jgi:ribosomal protein S27E